MKSSVWFVSWLVSVSVILCIIGCWVYCVDPYFHYHEPDVERYFYVLDNQRSQNDGISKNFDYDTLITGTSMTENFKTTEANNIFDCNSIKVSYSGGTYKEINDNVERALKANPKLKMVIRGLDMSRFLDSYELMRTDLGEYPEYLYDDNFINDYEYLLNRDIVLGKVLQMEIDRKMESVQAGITSFDEYSRWQDGYTFGINAVCEGDIKVMGTEQMHLTEKEKEIIRENIEHNVTNIADTYPDVKFYYFYTPYSAVNWNEWKNDGKLLKMLEAEAYVTELIVQHKNIFLFSFNNRTDITTDLNNYKDEVHYGAWINSLMLKWMSEGKYQLTENNYKDYLREEFEFYTVFDYKVLNGQADYEADYYAAALLNKELTGADPELLFQDDDSGMILDKTENNVEVKINLDGGHNYLYFKGQKNKEQVLLRTYVYDQDDVMRSIVEVDANNLDIAEHEYVIDMSSMSGMVKVIFETDISELEEDELYCYYLREMRIY